MKSGGVKQLKARLSEHLRLVRTGEIVLITDRDEVVAELRPARRQGPTVLSVEERLQALAEAGVPSTRFTSPPSSSAVTGRPDARA